MDWVKVYTIVIITIAIVGPMMWNGQRKSEHNCRYDWCDGFIGIIIMLPIYGRIFGYW